MRRSNHENIDVLMLIGLVTGEEEEEGEGGGKSHSKVGTRWVRQLFLLKLYATKQTLLCLGQKKPTSISTCLGLGPLA